MPRQIAAPPSQPLELVEIDPAGRNLVLLAGRERVRVVPLGAGKERSVLVRDARSLAVSDDGACLVVCALDTTTFFDLATLEKRWSLRLGTTGAAFSPDGSLLALALPHGSVAILHTVDGSAREIEVGGVRFKRPLFSGPCHALCFDAASDVLYGAGSAGIDALDIVTYELRGHIALDGAGLVVARCPVSDLVVVGGETSVVVAGSSVGARAEVEHLTVIEPGAFRASHSLALASSDAEADPLGRTGAVRRARFVPGRDVLVALHVRTDGTRVVHAWSVATGASVFSEVVAAETRDLAVDPEGGVWLLSAGSVARWRVIDA